MLLDYGRIIGRAAWARSAAGFIGQPPPYSTRHLFESVFKTISVAGANLPDGITEMAVADEQGRRALFYNRNVSHPSARVGLVHGLYHHLSDIKEGVGLRECNLSNRKFDIFVASRDPIELACDLFAAEVLIPFDVLDELAPARLYSDDPHEKEAIQDEVDHLSSRFNVPMKFMRWRLYDLRRIRQTHYNPET